MPPAELLLSVAVVCGLWAAVTAVLIARALERQGVRTPFPFLGLFIFRNLRRYGEITRTATGRTGPLFYSYVVPINAALILVVIAVVLFLFAGWSPAAAAPAQKVETEIGYRLLSDLVLLLDKAGQGTIDTSALNAGVLGLAKDLKTARDAKRVEPLFAVRYSRLLSAVRQGLLTDPELLYWPMYRFSMIDFIEERTGRMPDRDKLLFVVNDHGGSGVGLAMLVEPVMSEIVSLHIHLETLDRRPAILKEYFEKAQKARGAAK